MKWYSPSSSFKLQRIHFLCDLSILLRLPISILSGCDERRILAIAFLCYLFLSFKKDGEISKKKKVREKSRVPQSQTAAHPRPQEEEETDKSKQAQTEQTYEKN